MPKIKFGYNIEKDAWSWIVIAKAKDLWGLNLRDQIAHIPDELLGRIEKTSFPRAKKMAEEYIKNGSRKKYKEKVIFLEAQALEKSWRMVEEKYFKILSELTQKPIFTKEFGCYFTTGFMCPYNEKENWFMVSMWHSVPFSITTICHEIMHLQFLKYYKSYLKRKGLKTDQIENLKESLTFLLNEPEFEEIVLSQDYGYPEHEKLRTELKKIWFKNKDFKNLIDEAVCMIQK